MLREWAIKKMLECMENYKVTNSSYNTDYAFSHITKCIELEDVDAVEWFNQNYEEICDFMKDYGSPYDPVTMPIDFMECFYKEYGCMIFREITLDLPSRITIDDKMKFSIISKLESLLFAQK